MCIDDGDAKKLSDHKKLLKLFTLFETHLILSNRPLVMMASHSVLMEQVGFSIPIPRFHDGAFIESHFTRFSIHRAHLYD